jgi:Hemerythrin HHE cation binding domain
MSIIDKVVAAITPPESNDARVKARANARSVALPGDWLSSVLDHHLQIEALFAKVESANAPAARLEALDELATLLTGHSIAEEAALYPALAKADEKSHATMAYTEQSAAKLEMGLLQDLSPMSQDFSDKLAHIKGAVQHHVYEEEGNWFLDLKAKLTDAEQDKLTERYEEQFARYMGDDVSLESRRRSA